MISSNYITDFRIGYRIATDDTVVAANRYRKFQCMFGSQIYSPEPQSFALVEPSGTLSEPVYEHLDAHQSRAMEAALLASVEVLDTGFLIDE